jgi:MATE family multidrug resistance protein
VLLVSSSIVYQLPYALSVAGAVRIGNLLGARQPRLAKMSSEMVLFLSLATGSLNSAVFLTFRRQWGGWFTKDEEVIQLIYEVMPILAAFQVFDSVTGAAGGILRGIGMQKDAAVINVVGYYAIGECRDRRLLKVPPADVV